MNAYTTTRYTNKMISLFEIATILMSIKTYLGISAIISLPNAINTALVGISIFLMIVIVLKNGYKLVSIILMAILGAVILYSCIQADNYCLLLTYFCLIEMKNVTVERFIKIIYRIQVLILIIHFTYTGFMLFFNPQVILVKYFGGEVRISFGFTHPNTFSLLLAWVLLEWLWINYEKITKQKLFILLLIEVIAYQFAKTRTSLISLCIIFFLIYLSKKNNRFFDRFIEKLSKWSFPIISIIYIYFVNAYENATGLLSTIIMIVDKLLSYRIKLGSYGHSLYGYTFFGQVVSYNNLPWDSFYQFNTIALDSVFLLFAINYGIFYLIIISFALYIISKKGDTKTRIFVFAFVLYSITESQVILIYNCFVLCFFSYIIFKEKNNYVCIKYRA